MEWSKGKVFYEIGLNPKDFYDGQMTVAMKKPIFDMYKFDDYLHSRFGNYEEQGKSMECIIHENFPEQEERLKELFF